MFTNTALQNNKGHDAATPRGISLKVLKDDFYREQVFSFIQSLLSAENVSGAVLQSVSRSILHQTAAFTPNRARYS